MRETKDIELATKVPSSRLPSFSHGELSRRFGQTITVPSWAKYVPGPSPQHFFKRLPTSICQVGVILVGCWIFLISGTNLSMMGSLSSVPGYLEEIKLEDGSRKSQLLIGTANSIYYFDVLGGALFCVWFSDRVGRRRAVVAAGICGLFIVPLLAATQNFAWVLALRLLNGLFTGLFDAVGLNWCAESRGSSVGIIGHACGAFLINMVSPYLFGAIGHNVMFLFGGLSFLLGVLCYLWMPETARKSLEEISALYDEVAEPLK